MIFNSGGHTPCVVATFRAKPHIEYWSVSVYLYVYQLTFFFANSGINVSKFNVFAPIDVTTSNIRRDVTVFC